MTMKGLVGRANKMGSIIKSIINMIEVKGVKLFRELNLVIVCGARVHIALGVGLMFIEYLGRVEGRLWIGPIAFIRRKTDS